MGVGATSGHAVQAILGAGLNIQGIHWVSVVPRDLWNGALHAGFLWAVSVVVSVSRGHTSGSPIKKNANCIRYIN